MEKSGCAQCQQRLAGSPLPPPQIVLMTRCALDLPPTHTRQKHQIESLLCWFCQVSSCRGAHFPSFLSDSLVSIVPRTVRSRYWESKKGFLAVR
jgi:hypothetical protein